ncbi:unnamed protein product [Phytomonas sp. Hart1]|nr:unnamed protein product [Phytomonas sp. Hart1]|eukprot:CCW67369.1 unnamed protein product [Phytomonas sp. isolate Hart1]
MVSKYRKALRRQEARGTTYKLVHRSYEDQLNGESDGRGMVWVNEADLRRNHTTRRKGKDREDHYDYKEEGENWEDHDMVDWDDEDELELLDFPPTITTSQPPNLPGENSILHGDAGSGQRQRLENSTPDEDEEEVADDDKLFDDEMECEVTDDFLRELVFGGVNNGGNDEAVDQTDIYDFPGAMEGRGETTDPDHEGMRYGIPQDAWRLLTDEEKAGVQAANARGVSFGRSKIVPNAALGVDAITAQPYPVHDVMQGAMNRQFAEMMREFDVDAQINDAYTDDPRTHGALHMDKYMGALKEFIVERAGVDYSTSEPAKNKGLIHQLELLAYRAGVFDTDSHGGVYTTTMTSEKKKRFAEEFRNETERIRLEAALRQSRKALAEQQVIKELHPEQQPRKAVTFDMVDAVNNGDVSPKPSRAPSENDFCSNLNFEKKEDNALHSRDNAISFKPEEEEEFRIAVIKLRDKQLDCEKAVSVFSSYLHQPNVIRPTTNNSKPRSKDKCVIQGSEPKSVGVTLDSDTKASGLNGFSEGAKKRENSNSRHEETRTLHPSVTTLVPTIRFKDETNEEKKMRRQAVKMAQRERRQEKSALRKAYQIVSEVEKKRATTSLAAKRTVHFL